MSREFSPTTPIISYNSSDMIEEVVDINLADWLFDLSLMTLNGVEDWREIRPPETGLNNFE